MKRKISALPAIIIRITAIALTFWLGMMCLIPYGGIRDVNAQLEQELYVLDPDAAPYDKITNLASSITRPMPELNFPLAKEPASRAEIYENPVLAMTARICAGRNRGAPSKTARTITSITLRNRSGV